MTRVIKIEELTRVEGHGRIELVIEGESVKDAKMPIFEGPRFFEAFIETVNYDKDANIRGTEILRGLHRDGELR